MSQSKFSSKEFKALQKIWYETLRKGGFEDAESGPYLKEWDSHYFQARKDPLTFSLHADYYYWAAQFLNHHEFISNVEREIWLLHSQGIGYREIASTIDEATSQHSSFCTAARCDMFCEIKTGGTYIVNKDKVNMIVKRLRSEMMRKLREETPREE